MKKNTENLISFVMIAIGIIATAMIFFPALSFPNSDSSFLGYEVVFGTKFADLGSFASGQIVWSVLGILAYLTPLIASIATLYYKKRVDISMALFSVGALLLLTLPSYTKTTITIVNTVTEIEIDWAISYGLIIATVLSVIGVFLCLYKLIYKK